MSTLRERGVEGSIRVYEVREPSRTLIFPIKGKFLPIRLHFIFYSVGLITCSFDVLD